MHFYIQCLQFAVVPHHPWLEQQRPCAVLQAALKVAPHCELAPTIVGVGVLLVVVVEVLVVVVVVGGGIVVVVVTAGGLQYPHPAWHLPTSQSVPKLSSIYCNCFELITIKTHSLRWFHTILGSNSMNSTKRCRQR